MKKHICWLFFLSGMAITAKAGDWVKNFGDKGGNVLVAGVVTDSDHNAIITGTFTAEQLELDETHSLQNNGMYDVFLIKYDPEGEILWQLSFGGIKEDYVNDICLDNENNIYITGNFRSSTFKVGDVTINSSWPDNVYVAKFNRNGELNWLKNSTNVTNYSWGKAVQWDAGQHILITGFTTSPEMSFGNINLVLNTNNYKGFYCKLDPEGNYISADFLGDESEDQYQLNDIASDADGNMYLAGRKTIRTEPDPVTWSEYRDIMYFCKTDPGGEVIWTIEDTSFFQADRIILNNDSLIVLGNREEYRYIFNGGTIDTTSSFYYGVFDLNANKLWDRNYVGALAYDAYSGNGSILIIGGLLLDHLDFGEYQIHRNADSSSICPIYQDIFYLESDKSGEIKTVNSISGSLEDIPTAVWISGSGDLLYTGTYESYKLTVEDRDIINTSELSTFQHVSGTYYDRSIFSFLARKSGFTNPSGNPNHSPGDFTLYPNPSAGWIHIDTGTLTGSIRIKVYDLNGKLVYEDLLQGGSISINLSGLARGMYLVSCISNNSVVNKPLLLVK